jgi:tetratricopeptide (TPR) repeat protein
MDTPGRIAELDRKFGDNPRRYFAALANEYRKAGQLEKAIELCELHLAEQRNHLSGHVVLAQSLVDAGRPEAAWSSLHTALDLDPENFIALRLLGDLSSAAGDAEQARAYYFRALEIEPRNEQLLDALKSLGQRAALSEPSGAAPLGFEATSLTTGEFESDGGPPEPAEAEPIPTLADEAAMAAEPVAESLPEPLGDPGEELQEMMAGEEAAETEEAAEEAEEAEEAGEAGEEAAAPAAAEEWPSWDGGAPVEPAEPPSEDEAADSAAGELEAVAQWWEEPQGEAAPEVTEPEPVPEQPAPRATPSTPLVSETMVGLYLSQGHTALAIAALRDLVAAKPDDERLRARLEELERVTPRERRETVRDLFARLGRPRTVATPPASRDSPSSLDALLGASGVEPEPEDPAIAAALAADAPHGSSVDFDRWLTELREQ